MLIRRCFAFLVFGVHVGLAWPNSLPQIEQWAQESSDSIAMADIDTEIANQRLQIVNGQSGTKMIFGTTLGQYREPITDTTTRSYSGLNAVAGIRIPVIGSAEVSKRNVEDAQKTIQVNKLQREQKTKQITSAVRLAYSRYVINSKKITLTKAWLSLEDAVRPIFLARTKANALLESDRLALESGFMVARRDLDRYALEVELSLATMRRLSKQRLEEVKPQVPDWSTGCIDKNLLVAELEKQPSLAIKRVELESRARQMGLVRWNGVEAGVTLRQSLVNQFGGQSGYGTVLGFDMTLPLDFGKVNESHASEGQLRYRQAMLDLDLTLKEEMVEIDGVMGRLLNSQSDMDRSTQRLAASLEANRIALIRLGSMPGDLLEKALFSRYEVYQAAIDFEDTRLRHYTAQIEALSYGQTCSQINQQAMSKDFLVEVLAHPLTSSAPIAPASQSTGSSGLTWFLWQGGELLKSQPLQTPTGTRRILVSFSPEQISSIQTDAFVAQQLRQSLALLQREGMRVELVFGDASFLQPPGRKKLTALIKSMSSFNFDGLNLDLERSDMPQNTQHSWWNLTTKTVRAVKTVSTLPVTLTVHHRELNKGHHRGDYLQAGVASVMAMVYVNNLGRTTEIARNILSLNPNLPIFIVQSVEAELPTTESSYSLGRTANLLRWQELGQRLSVAPNFLGVAVQSLENFNLMAP